MQNGFITISSQNLILDCLLLWIAKCITETHLSCFIMWDKTCYGCALSLPPPQSNAEIVYIMSSLKSGASYFTHLSIGWNIEEGHALDQEESFLQKLVILLVEPWAGIVLRGWKKELHFFTGGTEVQKRGTWKEHFVTHGSKSYYCQFECFTTV